jgi:hypothetical protein
MDRSAPPTTRSTPARACSCREHEPRRASIALTAVIRVEQAVTEQAEALAAAGLDAPAPGEQLGTYALELRGWAIGAAEPAVGAELLHDGQPLRQVPIDVGRPRRAAAHPESKGRTTIGFIASQSVLTLPTEFELGVRIVLESGATALMATVRGTREPLRTTFESALQPLMVTTLGRTGSMALMRMLEAHPAVLVYRPYRYEQQVAGYWLDVFLTLADPSSYIRQIAPAGNLENPLWWLGSDLAPPRLRDSALERWLGATALEQLARTAQERIAAVYEQIAGGGAKPGARYFAEKHSLRTAALGSELYPGAREVFLVRDFRDMVASIMAFNQRRGVQGFGRAGAAGDAEWIESLSGWATSLVRAWQRRARRAHLVRYEDLILKPAETLTGMLEYAQIDSSPESVAAMRSTLSTEMPELAGHRTSREEESIGRWRTDLPDELVEACRRAFGEALAVFGYEPAAGA